MGVWSCTYPRWLPGGGACSQQHMSVRACDPACASEHCCHPTVVEGSVPAAVVALLVYVCVRAQECPDHRLFTKQALWLLFPMTCWHSYCSKFVCGNPNPLQNAKWFPFYFVSTWKLKEDAAVNVVISTQCSFPVAQKYIFQIKVLLSQGNKELACKILYKLPQKCWEATESHTW